MSFQHPYWLIPALLLFAAALWIRVRTQQDDWHRLMHPKVLAFLRPDASGGLRRQPVLLLCALAALALADPSLPDKRAETLRHSQAWFVLVDISRSMTLNDVAPSRLAAMREIAADLARRSQSHPIALIAFAGDAFMLTPPAFDTRHFNSNVVLLDHGLIPAQGSSLTRALSLANSVIESSQLLQARVFILGDSGGINTAAQATVSHLASRGHRTDLITAGSEDSGGETAFDAIAADNLARAGKGTVLRTDALGQVNLDALQLDRKPDSATSLLPSGVAVLQWHSLAHWVLLPGLWLLYLVFVQERT